MSILSLDIATRATGFAVFDNGELITSGVIKSSKSDFIERGREIAQELREIFVKHSVTDLVIEDLKVAKNQKVTVMIAIVHGIIIATLSKDCSVYYISPTEWRAGFNHGLNAKRELAKKRAIQLTEVMYGLKVSDDEAEAILLGKFFEKNKVLG